MKINNKGVNIFPTISSIFDGLMDNKQAIPKYMIVNISNGKKPTSLDRKGLIPIS